jgi:peroxiredoxin
MDVAIALARLVLAATFAVAGAAKLADRPGSVAAAEAFGVPKRLAGPVGSLLPLAELATAGLLLFDGTAQAGAIAALVLLTGFCAGITRAMIRGETPDCHCFGQIHSEPAGPRTLVRNLILAGIAVFALAAGPGDEGLLGWIESPDASGWAIIIAGLAVALVVAGGLWLFLRMLTEHGRLLLRVEALETALRQRGIAVPQAQTAEPEHGLAIGTQAPAFSLSGLHGDTTTLASLRAAGNPVLLVFTDPNCGPCRALLPKVGRWQREHADKLAIALISRGTSDEVQAEIAEHGVSSVLIEEEHQVSDAYRAQITPSAVLVEEGRVTAALAAGDAAIEALVNRAIAPRPEVVPTPTPAPPASSVGDELPSAELTDLEGQSVALTDALEGRERVLLLWDPNCGFCSRMLDDLKALETEDEAVRDSLLLVSRGDAAANREQGIQAPILLEAQAFALGRAIGAPGTPSAVAIDADGRVASEVAVGADAVLALARSSATPA